MNRSFFNIEKSFGAGMLALILAALVFAQPPLNQKQIDAKAAFDEGVKLHGEGTFRSYQLALEKFQTSARLYEELGDRGNVGSALLGVGLIKNLLDENNAALENYQKALAIFRELGHKSLEARTLNNLGRLYDDTGEKQKALEFHFQALPLRKEIGDRHGEGVTLNSIGAVYADLGERQKALDYFNRSLAIRKELAEIPEIAITLNNIGLVYDDLGERQKALGHLEQSLIFRRAARDKAGEATTLNNIGKTTAGLNEPVKAIAYFEQALKILSEIGLENMKAAVLNNIGTAYLDQGNRQKSLEYFHLALPLYRAAGNSGGAATALNNIGRAEIDTPGKLQSAFANFHLALTAARSSQEKELEAIVLSNLMHAAKKAGQVRAAIFYGKQSINSYQELRRAIRGLEAQTQRSYLRSKENDYRFLADLLIEADLFAQAERVLQMLKEEEYSEFVSRDPDEIKNLNQRAELTLKEMEVLKRYALLAGRVTALGQDFSKLDEKKRRLSRMNETLAPEEQKTYDELAAQLSDANAAFKIFLEKRLLLELGREQIKRIEYDRSLQAKLAKWGKGTVALYTVVTGDRYRVVLTTPNAQVDGKHEIKAADLNKKIFAFREALRNRAVDPRPLGKELYDILLAPIEKDLQAAGAKTLLWSLDGRLRYIPLAALSPDGSSYLIEKYTSVILTPKTRDNVFQPAADWRILGLGVSQSLDVIDPDEPAKKVSFRALPGVKRELAAIVREENAPAETGILTGQRFLDKDFTIKSLADSLAKENDDGKQKFNVVHIASHFRLGNNWTNSFLLLGDGNILTLEQIGNSPQISFGDVDLVTLSACNTAFASDSNGKEVDSLAEAIQTKSGKAILATLWSVSDEATSQLMSEFYRLKKEGQAVTKADAMQAAQKALIGGKIKVDAELAKSLKPEANPPNTKAFAFDESKPFAHPYYWSPFVLIGNWR